MKTTVLINCYNYEPFVVEAIRSVASQSVRPDELVVVDDGSTDGSAESIQKVLDEIGFGRLVRKENGGQLSAFQAGIEESTGDWVFFLDADDCYQPDHVETVLGYIAKHPKVDFLFSDVEEFGEGEGRAFHYRGPDGDLGYSALLVKGGSRVANVFVGGVTSALCIHRKLLERMMPFGQGLLDDWRIRADNVLVYGTSVAGARKFNTGEKTVRYRLHGDNAFAGARRDKATNAYNVLITQRLLGHLQEKIPYSDDWLSGLGVEYRGIPNKNAFLKKSYWKTALCGSLPFMVRLRVVMTMLKSDWL